MTDHLTEADRALCEALERAPGIRLTSIPPKHRVDIDIAQVGRAAQRIRELSRDKAELQALADKLAEALGEVLIGGNHLALLIGADHPPYTATTGEALTHYGAGDAYEVWCCWRSIMHAREALAAYTLHKIDG